jgi:hypothetical protein
MFRRPDSVSFFMWNLLSGAQSIELVPITVPMDNVKKHDNFINLQSSQTFRSHLRTHSLRVKHSAKTTACLLNCPSIFFIFTILSAFVSTNWIWWSAARFCVSHLNCADIFYTKYSADQPALWVKGWWPHDSIRTGGRELKYIINYMQNSARLVPEMLR